MSRIWKEVSARVSRIAGGVGRPKRQPALKGEPTLRLADATSNVMKSRNQLQKRED
jgi:hypothetical protein